MPTVGRASLEWRSLQGAWLWREERRRSGHYQRQIRVEISPKIIALRLRAVLPLCLGTYIGPNPIPSFLRNVREPLIAIRLEA